MTAARTSRLIATGTAVLALAAVGAGIALPAQAATSQSGTKLVAAATPLHILPGQSWQSVLSKAVAGDTVTIDAGTHPVQFLKDLNLSKVKIVGADRAGTVVQGIYLYNSGGMTFQNMTITSPASGSYSAVRITAGSHDVLLDQVTVLPKDDPAGRSGLDVYSNSGSSVPPYRITMTNSLIDADLSTGTASRGVRIWGGDFDESTWPHDISVIRSEVRNASGDIIQIGGGKNILIADNLLHDPKENADHNDGVQSYGSRNLQITGNRIWAVGSLGGPDQGIIVGSSVGKTYLRVNQTKISNNVIAGWRGQGICVAGADDTLVRQNTVVDNGGSSLVVGRITDQQDTKMTVADNIFDRIERADPITLAYENYNIVTRSTGNPRGANTLVTTPGFAETNDYTLSSTSKAVNAGNASVGTTFDYLASARSGANDIGAREYAGTGKESLPTGMTADFTTKFAWGNTATLTGSGAAYRAIS